MAVVTAGHLAYPYLYGLLIAVGYGLMLPAIAVLHERHRAVRRSGAVFGTIAGTATVVVGLAGAVSVDLQPAALFVLGMWWWTLGKMWIETGVVRGGAGPATAVLGVLAIAGAFAPAVWIGLAYFLRADLPFVDVWRIAELTLGAWLVALAAALSRAASEA